MGGATMSRRVDEGAGRGVAQPPNECPHHRASRPRWGESRFADQRRTVRVCRSRCGQSLRRRGATCVACARARQFAVRAVARRADVRAGRRGEVASRKSDWRHHPRHRADVRRGDPRLRTSGAHGDSSDGAAGRPGDQNRPCQGDTRARGVPGSLRVSTVAITCGAGLVIAIMTLGVIDTAITTLIPVGSMLIANAMNTNGLALNRFRSDVPAHIGEIETALALGADPRQSVAEYVQESFEASLIPAIDSLRSLGIVRIPGLMAGMLLSGSRPIYAAIYPRHDLRGV